MWGILLLIFLLYNYMHIPGVLWQNKPLPAASGSGNGTLYLVRLLEVDDCWMFSFKEDVCVGRSEAQ